MANSALGTWLDAKLSDLLGKLSPEITSSSVVNGTQAVIDCCPYAWARYGNWSWSPSMERTAAGTACGTWVAGIEFGIARCVATLDATGKISQTDLEADAQQQIIDRLALVELAGEINWSSPPTIEPLPNQGGCGGVILTGIVNVGCLN